MAHKRKDTFAKSREWAKHLRPSGKREQVVRERKAAQREIHKATYELDDSPVSKA